uniref:Uncharacterized protein n=1 Tax=Caenorhabditis japonica TaxID=281687 RepID=A0A8R1E304_CAEJA
MVDKVSIVLSGIENLLDFVEMGTSSEQRINVFLALNTIKNMPFWALTVSEFDPTQISIFLCLQHLESIGDSIDRLKPRIQEVSDLIKNLLLDQLKPRNSSHKRPNPEIQRLEQQFQPRLRSSFI